MISNQHNPLGKQSSIKPMLVVNGRFQVQRVTGVQRYAHEIVSRLSTDMEIVAPKSAKGIIGHLWEQTMLPWKCEGRLLWSPNASGPMTYSRQVVTFHDLFPIENPEWYHPAYAKWYSVVMRRLAAQAVHLIAVSEFTKGRIVKVLGRSPDEISVIPNGCHVAGRASEEHTQQAATALDLPSRHYILSLSSLEKRKNVSALLEAWSTLHAQLPQDVWLVLAGPKADTTIFGEQGKAVTLPRVFYTGYVPEQHLAGLYSGASLFVFPSLAEGFGLPLLEAMAAGVRCISSNSTSLPEVGGDAVEYIDPTKPADLVAKIRTCYKQQLGLLPYEPSLRQSSRFTWDSAAGQTLHVLQSSAEAGLTYTLPSNYMERRVVQ